MADAQNPSIAPPTPAAQPVTKPRRSRACLVAGLLLVAAGAGLVVWFMQDPLGAIPGFPTYWRGVPAVLGIGFFLSVGGFLMLQRHFSLAAFLTGAVVSGVVTAGLQAYVHSFRETASMKDQLVLNGVSVRDFNAACREVITTDRLVHFALDSKKDMKASISLDFDEVLVFVTPAKNKHEDAGPEAELELQYRYSTFLHEGDGNGRRFASYYANFLAAWTREKMDDKKLDFAATAEGLDARYSGYLYRTVYIRNPLINRLAALIWTISLPRKNVNLGITNEIKISELDWLASREPDPELKAFLANVAESLRVRWKLPPKPQGK